MREFRPRRSLAATCAAAALATAGVLGTSELILVRLHGRGRLPESLGVRLPERAVPEAAVTGQAGYGRAAGWEAGPAAGPLTWNDPAVLWTCAGLAAAGLVLLLLAVLPGRGRMVALCAERADCLSGVSRPGLRRILAAAALGVPGIERARVRLRGGFRPRVAVRVTTGYRNPGGFQEQVYAAVQARIAELAPVRPPRVAVRLRWRDE